MFHDTEDYTIYPAPIITVTKNRFTKHYFIGDRRIASKLGTGKFSNVYGISGNNVTAGQKNYAARMLQIEKQREEYYRKLGTPPGVPTMKGATADPDNTGYGYNTIIGELGDHSVPEGWVQRPKFNDKGDVPGPPIQWQKPEDPDNAQPGYGYVPVYPAPILSVTRQRFTKHYFIGDRRVASKIGAGIFQNAYGHGANVVTAGRKDYQMRMMQIERQREDYYRKLGTPPGVPTMKGATADPDNTGYGYNTIIGELGDHSVPEGWVQRPKFNDKGDVPGPPIQWNKPEDPDNAQPGYGYVPADTAHHEDIFYYHTDHLGSTSYITDAKANVAQFDAYLPYGELLVDEHSSSEEMPYKFNGKEFDEETGLYYYGARYMNPVTSLWYGVDPLAEKYVSTGSYVYCIDNPIRLIDPDGRKVKADVNSQKNIYNILTKEDAKYVKFDKNGILDVHSLQKLDSKSDIIQAIKTLANSDITYSFEVKSEDDHGKKFKDGDFNFYRGVTEIPGAESQPSKDNDVHIIVGINLSEKQQAKTTAHEGMGHAYIYELTRDYKKASHDYQPTVTVEWDEELQQMVPVMGREDKNILLAPQIKKVVSEAERNYNENKK